MRVSNLLLGALYHSHKDVKADVVFTGCQADKIRSQPGWENVKLDTDGSECIADQARGVSIFSNWHDYRNETTGKWMIPFYIEEEHYNSDEIEKIRSHARQFEKNTCIQMKELITAEDFDYFTNRIKVFSNPAEYNCASKIGKIGGTQPLWLQPDCINEKGYSETTTNHEFMHALGFKHEHSRPDRDDYVYIHPAVIDNGNYAKMLTSIWTNTSSPYDFKSIMHYEPGMVSDGKWTIGLPPDGQERAPVEHVYPFSEQDIYQMMIVYPCDDANRCDPNPCGDGQTCVLDATNQPICECPEGSLLNSAGTCQVVASMAVDDFSDLVNYKFIRLRRSPSVSLFDNNGLVIDLASADASEITVLAEVEECGESLTVDECPLEKNSAILNGESATLSSLIFLKSVNQRLRFSLRKNGVNFLPDIWSISGEFVIKDGLEAAPWNITWTGDHSTKYFGAPLEITASFTSYSGESIDLGPGERDIQACLWLNEAGTNGLAPVERKDLFYECRNADQFGNFDLDNITFYFTDVDDHVAVPAGNYFLSLRIVAFDSWGPEDMFFLDENYGGSVMSSGIFELTLSDTCAQECNANGYCHPTASTFGTPSCVCNDGYEGDGVDYCIEVIDECTSNPCPAEQECLDKLFGYDCICGSGFYKGTADDCLDIDECADNLHVCSDGTSCENTFGGYFCNADNNQPSCDPNCDAGFFCDSATETCVDIDECSEGTHDCKDFESCRNTNGKFMCDFDNSQCRDDLPRPEWKGRSGMRYVYQSSNGAVMGMKFKNKFKTVNIRNELYTGVIMFTKTVCGMDFLRALQDGRVRIDLVDSSPLYQMHDFHYKNQQKYSAIGFTFDLLSIETKDMPWSFKSGIPTKNMGSDDVYISFTGLEQVNWLTNQENCLLLGAQAALPYDDFDEVDRACFVDLKTFWKTPPLPNP